MLAKSMNGWHPYEIGDSDTYNRVQMRRAVQARGDPTADWPGSPAGELLRVLIVDDHRASADTTSMLVRAWGHDVRRAYDGTIGLALAASFQPDVLLLDIVMPHISGVDLARKMRQQTQVKNCFIVAISGRTDSKCLLQSVDAGVDLFLIKPVVPSILQALLVWESGYVFQRRHQAALRSLLKSAPEVAINLSSRTTRQTPDNVLQSTVAI